MKQTITRRRLLKTGLLGGGAVLLLSQARVQPAAGDAPRFLPVSPLAQAAPPANVTPAPGATPRASAPGAPPQPPAPAAPQDPDRPDTRSLQSQGDFLTTNQGVRVSDDQNSLRAGSRGPTLLEDHHFREKLTQFDHERIPERVVHARGSGAHGVFQVYQSMARYTAARFLQDPSVQTPVFVRFSTVNGFRGSADTARDARGFATKFYTDDGNFDLVGNNIPVFFIQDAIKFPDLVHAFKPEPRHEIPQASTAHDSFWDFTSLTPESMHMIMWIMSDRAIPRSFRMMEGFGVHTFRFVNAQGNSTFVKFHWKPLLGVHSLVWDEAQKLAGVDPDFHRRDLWQAIEMGAFPQYEFGVQLLDERDQGKVGFDILDATKIWPENLVPVQPIGKMTLNKNPDNFFEETEQAAFHVGHVVPGIDFTDDPLLQGRIFSYLDTQLNRFNSPNFAQLPINRPRANVNNYQQDGYMRYANRADVTNYEPTSRGVKAAEANASQGGLVSYPEQVNGPKVRQRSDSFGDHFSQATLFWNSMSAPEQQHITQALQFELGRVTNKAIQQRMLALLANVDGQLAANVAGGLGLPAPAPGKVNTTIGKATGLSQAGTVKNTVQSRLVAILAADGVAGAQVAQMQAALKQAGANTEIVAPHAGAIQSAEGQALNVDKTFLTAASVQYDAVYVPGGAQSLAALKPIGNAVRFVGEAFKHYKAIAATAEGRDLLTAAGINTSAGNDPALIVAPADQASQVAQNFIKAIAQHRNFARQGTDQVPA